ncbi:hypothetical protein RRG08_013227 [Elysia crispata]|uniref:Hexosyltransferase n=1 Tax=Elysia crispata TaxID=231223 RepID=A0AAE1DYK7_9GAST|nr:hypothetical protein RRG08_013227 [Elysia crispata]
MCLLRLIHLFVPVTVILLSVATCPPLSDFGCHTPKSVATCPPLSDCDCHTPKSVATCPALSACDCHTPKSVATCPALCACDCHTPLLFVLARPAATIKARSGSSPWSKLSPEQQWAALQHEASTHGDLLYLNMQDSYFNLTLKLISAFQWVREHCTTIKFVLKVDSDTFVNVPLLLDLLMLNEKRLKYSVLGTIYTHDRTVHRSGKWAVNDSQYPPPVYPVYASGCNYALSSAALAQITEIAPYFAGNHVSTFLGADYFVTGILGVPLALEFFDVMDHQVFGQCNKTSWHVCDMVSANRVFGYVGPSRGKATSLAYIWRAFYRFYGH